MERNPPKVCLGGASKHLQDDKLLGRLGLWTSRSTTGLKIRILLVKGMVFPPKKSSLPTFNHCFGIGAALAIDMEVKKHVTAFVWRYLRVLLPFCHSSAKWNGIGFRLERASRLVTDRIMTGQHWSWVSLAANGKPSCFIWWKHVKTTSCWFFVSNINTHNIHPKFCVQPQGMRTMFGKFGKSFLWGFSCCQFNFKGCRMFGMNPVPVWACCFFGASGGFLAFSNVRWRDVGNSEITACDSTSYNRGH